jgi:hypothetical protein
VTFGSDGHVAAVAEPERVSEAARCIREALSKAEVPPFAEPSFSAPVTIRPN